MDGGKLPGPGPDAAGIAPHAMLNLGEPRCLRRAAAVKGATAGGPRRKRRGRCPSAGARQVDADASAAPGLGGSRRRRAPRDSAGASLKLAHGSLGSLGSAFKQSPLSVANKNKTRSVTGAAAARREARERERGDGAGARRRGGDRTGARRRASPPAAAEENAPGALTKSFSAAHPHRLRFDGVHKAVLSPHSWLLSVLGSGARDGAAAKAAAQHAAAAMDASASARDSLDALFAEPLTGGSNKAPTPATVNGRRR